MMLKKIHGKNGPSMGVMGIEMEAAALYMNAAYAGGECIMYFNCFRFISHT